MEAEHFILYNSSKRQVIKEVGKILPDIWVPVFSKALIIESIDLGDLSTLMVSSKNGNSISESNLEQYKKSYRLERIIASINIVSHKQVVGVRRKPSNSEEFHEIVILSMDVSANSDWRTYRLHIGFFRQNLLCLND